MNRFARSDHGDRFDFLRYSASQILHAETISPARGVCPSRANTIRVSYTAVIRHCP
jgi:hypothetical protein